MSETSARKPRADAERNRERLLGVAKAVFAKKGEATSLEEIAREAGVGIGTLYRHFPTRDALVTAVYRQETEQLSAAGKRLASELPPVEAMRTWMLLFVDYMTTKHGMLFALDALVDGTKELYAHSEVELMTTMRELAARAVASGEVRLHVDPIDLLRAVAGVGKGNPSADWSAAAKQLVDILIAGIRVAGAPAKPSVGMKRRRSTSMGR